ncbi:TRAM domain-containing protein [Patescibacteria group bacterium]|nr:TRAM domain-containing protein [Patescibacteria group bacterium]
MKQKGKEAVGKGKHSENVPVVKERVSAPGSAGEKKQPLEAFTKPTSQFTQALAREIVKNLANIGQMTARPFHRAPPAVKKPAAPAPLGDYPIYVDTSVLIDGRILPIVNSGFLVGTLLIPRFVLDEVQHIADSADSLRRAKGRRGLEVVEKLKDQKGNSLVKTKIITDDVPAVPEVDHKLVELVKAANNTSRRLLRRADVRGIARLLTVDFNLGQYARAQGVKVMNVNDIAQALKVALMAGEELMLKITHEGKEREQGVGYLPDGTMVVVDGAKIHLGQEIAVVITKVHQTAAGQLFFARLK